MTALQARVAALPGDRQRLLDRLRPHVPVSQPGIERLKDPVKDECRTSYNATNRSLDATPFGRHSRFLNYGYVANSNEDCSVVTLPDFCLNKNSVRLVLETIGDCDVRLRQVLDVGCGRGGTVSVLLDYFQPASVNGVDLSQEAIRFCRADQRDPRARFDVGDAEQLPFADASFDVVTNLESSCCYPHLERFYREVHRVLRPDGWFLYTDCLPVQRSAWAAAELEACGFVMTRDRDITSNVLRSCDEVARSRVSSFGESSDDAELEAFLGVPGSLNYENMRSGRSTYRIRTLRRRNTRAA